MTVTLVKTDGSDIRDQLFGAVNFAQQSGVGGGGYEFPLFHLDGLQTK